MKRKIYFVFLVSMTLVSLGCCVALFSITSCSGQPSPDQYTVENMDFDFDKWYEDANVIKKSCNFPDVSWEDDVFNPNNQEYLLEVCFNEDIYPDNIHPVELQYLFIERYYGTCTEKSQEWFDWYKEYKGY